MNSSPDFEFDDRRTEAYFNERATRFGDDPLALDWGSEASQQVRFDVLSKIGINRGDSILDVGCGQGDFALWLRQKGIEIKYTGLDLSDRMIEIAQKKVMDGCFFKGSILDFDLHAAQFDWVVASGIFYLRQHQPYEFIRRAVESMFVSAKQGVAFNTLADWGGERSSNNEFRAKPDTVIGLSRRFTPFLTLRADYHPMDITFYLYKIARFG